MQSLKLAEKRYSVREYKNKPLEGDTLKALNHILENPPTFVQDTPVDFVRIDNGFDFAPLLEGHAGYSGLLIKAPHYYAVLSPQDETAYRQAGYLGEWFILKALAEEVGSCWLEVHNSPLVKNVLKIDSEKDIIALIAIGYGKKEVKLSKLFAGVAFNNIAPLNALGYPHIEEGSKTEPAKDRKSILDIVYKDKWGQSATIEYLESNKLNEPLFYMRLAPSYENRQPWKFMISKGHIELYIEKALRISPAIENLDAGIAMLYFEIAMHDKGLRGSWEMNHPPQDIEVPENNKWIGTFVQ